MGFRVIGKKVYSVEAQSVFDAMPHELTTGLRNAIAIFVDSQVSSGNWDKIIDFVYGRLNTESNSLKGWKGNFNASLEDGAWWTMYQGWWTTGVGPYINTDFIPNDYAGFGLSDAGFGASVRVNESTGTGTKFLFGSLLGGGQSFAVGQSGSAGSTLTFTMNSATLSSSSVDNVFNDHTYYGVDRINGTEQRLIIDGEVAATASTSVAAAKATDHVYLGARDNAGSPTNYLTGTYGYYVAYQAVGFDHVSFRSACVALDAAIDNILGDLIFLFDFGQSNAGGAAEANRLLALTEYTEAEPIGCNVWQKTSYNTTTTDGGWKPLSVGVNSSEQQSPVGVFGAGVTFLQQFISNQNKPAFYVNGGRGGSSLYATSSDWNPASVGECFDISFDAIFTTAYNKLVQHFPNNTIKVAMCWHQGEADAVSNSAAYAASFEALITAVRAYHSSLATAPLIMTKLYYNLNAGEIVINDSFDTYAGANANAYVIDPASEVTYPRKVDLPSGVKSTYPPSQSDDNHNSYEFQAKKGELIYDKLIEIGYL